MDEPEQPSGGSGDETVATEAAGSATDPRAARTSDRAIAGGRWIDEQVVGRYQLRGVLGAGAMGVVYDGWDPQLRRRVAVKLVRPDRADDAARARMVREAQALAQVSHPNVIGVFDVGEHAGEVYVATELIDGETMLTWQAGRTPNEIVGAWIQVARGLAAAHAEGVVHRDVKPANVLVGRDGRVRIGDFGLARFDPGADDPDAAAAASPMLPGRANRPTAPAPPAGVITPVSGEASTALGEVPSGSVLAGTPAYMAPEQRRGEFDARSDQFALCVSLAEALTGRRPAADADVAVSPAALAAALRRGLRDDPARRFPDIDQLADALAAAISPSPARPRRRTGLIAIAVAAVVGIGAVVAWGMVQARDAGACTIAKVPPDLWPPARRAAIVQRFAPNVAPRMDRWAAAWSAAAADVCTVERDAPAMRARRQRCLAEQLGATRRQLALWDEPTRGPGEVQAGLDELPRAVQCSHAVQSRTSAPSAAQAERMAKLRTQIIEAALSGDTLAAVGTVSRLVEVVRSIGHVPYTVEAMVALAALQLLRDAPAAQTTLREALALAERAHDDPARLVVMTSLIRALTAADLDQAVALADTARALNVELGGDPVAEARLELALGGIYRLRNQNDDALAAFERARRGFRDGFGEDSMAEAGALYGLAGAYAAKDPTDPRTRKTLDAAAAMFALTGFRGPGAGALADADGLIAAADQMLQWAHRLGPESESTFTAEYNFGLAYALKADDATALEHYRRAVEVGERLGLRDPRLSEAYSQIAIDLVDQNRPADALPAARRAVAIAEDLAVDSELGYALHCLGLAELEVGDPGAARAPLERALEIRDRLKEAGQFRGYTRFLLARALADSDRTRARSLAEAARVDIESFLSSIRPGDLLADRNRTRSQARIAQIDAWLAAHP